jgi:hypothetical protein
MGNIRGASNRLILAYVFAVSPCASMHLSRHGDGSQGRRLSAGSMRRPARDAGREALFTVLTMPFAPQPLVFVHQSHKHQRTASTPTYRTRTVASLPT